MNIEVIRPSSRLNATSNIRITGITYHQTKLYVGFANGDFSVFDVDTTFIPPTKKAPSISSFKSLNDIRTYFSESKSSNFSHDVTFPNINGDSTSISRISIVSVNSTTNRIILAVVNQDIIKIFEKVGGHLNLVQTIGESKYFNELFCYEINEKKYMAIGIKKKILILQMVYKTRNLFQYQKIHEQSLKDRVRAISSINLDMGLQLLVATSTDFVLMDINNDYIVSPFFIHDADSIGTFNQSSFTYFGLSSTGPSVFIIKVSDEEYCLIKDTQTLIVRLKDSKIQVEESNIKLGSIPIFVGLIYPAYLLIMYNKKVEIVEISTGDVIQKIHHQINSNSIPIYLDESFIFLGATNDLLQFNICSYQQQIDQYLKFLENDKASKRDPGNDVSLKGLEKAISFIQRLDEEDEYFGGTRVGKEKRKQLYLRDLYKLKAIILFERYSKYNESLVGLCSEWLISYREVLGLFPDFLSTDNYLNNIATDPEILKLSKSFIKKISLDDVQQMRNTMAPITTGADSATELDGDTHSKYTNRSKQFPTTIFGQTKVQNLHKFQKAVNNLIIYLSDQRRIHLNFFHDESYFWKNINVTPYDLYEFFTPETYQMSLDQIAIDIDTSLFLCYFHCKPMLLGPLLRLPNNKCDAVVVKQCLLSNIHSHENNNFIKELLDFYYGRNLHQEALEMLYTLSHDSPEHENEFDDFLHSSNLTIQYLQKLDNTHLELILKYSHWLLTEETQNPLENGRLVFMNDTYECESYDNLKVLEFFNQIGNNILSIQYIEWIIFESDLTDNSTKTPIIPKLHTNLALLYLQSLKAGAVCHLPFEEFKLLKYYKDLYHFLKTTEVYEPWTVLKYIPTDNPNFLRFTIFIYKRLSEHDKAIDVLYNQLDDLDEAMNYCSDIYNSNNKEYGSNLLHKLLDDLLMHYTENIEAIKKLLVLQGSKMSTLKVLTSLPNTFPIFKLTDYLDEQLRNSTQSVVNTRVSSQLYKVGSIKLQHELLMTQSQGYVIESSKKLCSICHKRLGYSIFSIEGDKVVHYACQQRQGQRQGSKGIVKN